MNVAQALAHCSGVLELALGDRRPPRELIGRIFGRLLKRLAVTSEAPIRRNAPTLKEFVVLDERNLDAERNRLMALLERFAAGGAAVCTDHPHPFFGRMTPQEWGTFEYKHLDHHLRQFGG
jgi:transposase InsO family protein